MMTRWEYDAFHDYWICGHCDLEWTMNDGTPKENGMNYCPRCGHLIIEFICDGSDENE